MVNRRNAARHSLLAARKKATKLQAASGKLQAVSQGKHRPMFNCIFSNLHICFHSLVFSTGIISSFHCIKSPAMIRLLDSFTSHK